MTRAREIFNLIAGHFNSAAIILCRRLRISRYFPLERGGAATQSSFVTNGATAASSTAMTAN